LTVEKALVFAGADVNLIDENRFTPQNLSQTEVKMGIPLKTNLVLLEGSLNLKPKKGGCLMSKKGSVKEKKNKIVSTMNE